VVPAVSPAVIAGILDAGLAVLPPKMDTPEARWLLIAIAQQESAWTLRKQTGGPARGFWQCEQGGGLADVMVHEPTWHNAYLAAMNWAIPFGRQSIFEALAWHDPMACVVARLILWLDVRPLPDRGDLQECWNYYVSNWRPGRPGPDRWAAACQLADRCSA
jgi:hypothetical protein